MKMSISIIKGTFRGMANEPNVNVQKNSLSQNENKKKSTHIFAVIRIPTAHWWQAGSKPSNIRTVKIINLPCVESSFPFIISISLGFQPFEGLFELTQHPSTSPRLLNLELQRTTLLGVLHLFSSVRNLGEGLAPFYPCLIPLDDGTHKNKSG